MNMNITKCTECKGERVVTWNDDGFVSNQTHHKDCSLLEKMRKQYPEKHDQDLSE
jgi:hypothetical protein